MPLHFDLVDLRLMVHVAERNSVTHGARAVHLSSPAASTRIKNIEEGIGTRLLDRSPHGVTLTPPGHAFVAHARQVLAQIEQLSGDLQEFARGIKGHVRVDANTSALAEFLPPVLRSYLLAHPDVNVLLRERLSHDIVRAVSGGEIDIGIVAGDVHTEKLEVIPYRSDRLVLVVAPGHPLAAREAVAFEETLAFDHVGLHEASALHDFLLRICAQMHRTLRLRIQVASFETACRMIEASVGIGVMQSSAAMRHARAMSIRIVPLTDAWAVRELVVCVRSLPALPAFARELVALLEEDARRALG
jgi:DNA-binding transcriptional LysR family regulator